MQNKNEMISLHRLMAKDFKAFQKKKIQNLSNLSTPFPELSGTPLRYAVEHGSVVSVNFLLNLGAQAARYEHKTLLVLQERMKSRSCF